jgi:VWFA-related protein
MHRLLLAAVLAAAAPLFAQVDPSRLPSAETTSVLVDVVVRDGKGRPVTGLSAADFEVLEDGAPQTIGPFTAPEVPADVPRASLEGSAAELPLAGAPSGTLAGRDTIAFVFDRLSTEGRVAAIKAVRRHLEGRSSPLLAGIFSIESVLVVHQDFTPEQEPLLAALAEVETRVAHTGDTQVAQARSSTRARLQTERAVAVLARTPPGPAQARAKIAAAQLSMAQAMDDAFASMARDEHGFATAHALTAIVDALRLVPGRKAVVLFSEALFRTEATQDRFLSVIHAANRASVSVYAVEAAGLSITSYESLTAAELHSAADVSMARQESGEDTGGGAFTRNLERSADLVQYSPRASLQWISDSTGGTFVRDTNDLEGGLGRIGSDLRSYYLLGYTPKNDQFDGRFRKIAVRVKRKGVEVRARSGYFAVRSAGPVLAHVAPALAVLERGQKPRAIGVIADAISFPDPTGPARAAIAVTVPGAEVSRIAARGKGRLDVTLLVRVLDAEGKPLDAMSRRFVVERGKPAADLLLLRDAWLSPGRYQLEAVAYDAGGQAGTATSAFVVGEGARPLDCAQAVIVKGAVPAGQAPVELESGHPLLFGDVVLLPLGGEPLPSRPARALVLQVTVPPSRSTPVPTGVVSLWRGDKSLGQSGLQWSGPDASGLLRHVAEVPGGVPGPGHYELRVSLSDVASDRVLSVPFTVAE